MGRAGIREDTIEEGEASEELNVVKSRFFSVCCVVILQVEHGWKQDSRFFSH